MKQAYFPTVSDCWFRITSDAVLVVVKSTSEEVIGREDRAREMLLRGLRLAEGVDAVRFAARTGMGLLEALELDVLEQAQEAGYVTWDGARLVATSEGRLRLDALLGALVR